MGTTKMKSGYETADAPLKIAPKDAPEHEEHLLDQAIAESFPASDPISPAYESSLEPVLFDNSATRAEWKRRLRKATPSLIAIGSIALVTLAAVYVLRERRSSLPDWRQLRGQLRDYIPWKH